MAAAVHPTLLRMIQEHADSSNPLPASSFVYGIHWSPTRVKILVHFPSYDPISNKWEFRQVVMANHWTGIQETINGKGGFLYEDVTFLRRWRLSIAFLAIRSHIDYLERRFPFEPCADPLARTRRARAVIRSTPDMSKTMHVNPRISTYLEDMHACWKGKAFVVPSTWIVSAPATVSQALRAGINRAYSHVPETLHLRPNQIHAGWI